MKLRRSICCLLCTVLLLLTPLSSQAVILDDCGRKKCICFLQKNDEGIAVRGITELLVELGYIEKATSTYTQDVVDAVTWFQEDYQLNASGMMDDDTLTLLIYGMLADEMTAEYPEYDESVVYISTSGGKKYHLKKTCSNMENPRKMSARNAQGLGIEPCKKCVK